MVVFSNRCQLMRRILVSVFIGLSRWRLRVGECSLIRVECCVRANGTRSTLYSFFDRFFFVSGAIFSHPYVEFIYGLDGENHADGAAQAQAGIGVADING